MNEIINKMNSTFVNSFRFIQKEVHDTAKLKGWWDEPVEIGTKIALMHSELSEALEAIREDKDSNKIPQFLGVEEELADVIIRIMDDAEKNNWNVAEAILAKMKYNNGREYKHGGKKF